MGYDSTLRHKYVGLRFGTLPIPPGSKIEMAYIQFCAYSTSAASRTLRIQGDSALNTLNFDTANKMSTRSLTTAYVDWTLGSWTIDDNGAAQRTVSLTNIVQELVDRPGWTQNMAI